MRTNTALRAIRKLLPMVVIIMLVVTGCTSASPTTSLTPVPIFTPAIDYINVFITEAGDSLSGNNVHFFVSPAENADTSVMDIIYYLDVIPPVTPGQPAYSAPGTYMVIQAIDETAIWENVPPGENTFSAQIVNPDNNTPFNPPVIVQSIITVPPAESKSPEIRIISVQISFPISQFGTEVTQSPLPPLEVQVSASVHNIKLNDDNIGKQNVAGEGHIIYYLDVEPPTTPGQPATASAGTFIATTDDFHIWENVLAGTHTFSIQLVNNDNTPLDSPVIAQITTTLPEKY